MEKSKQKLIGVTGVYAILLDDKIRYIGSGSNLESRKSNHLANLRKGKHTNIELQKKFDEYGEDKFKFYVLDYCDKESLFTLERLHMKIHKDTIVNKNRVVDTSKKIRTAKEKADISKKFSKIMRGENNPNCRLSEEQAREIIKLKQQKVKYKYIAELYSISVSQISKIGKERWGYLV